MLAVINNQNIRTQNGCMRVLNLSHRPTSEAVLVFIKSVYFLLTLKAVNRHMFLYTQNLLIIGPHRKMPVVTLCNHSLSAYVFSFIH